MSPRRRLSLSVLGLQELCEAPSSMPTHIVSLVDPGTRMPVWFSRVRDERRLIRYVHDALDSDDTIRAPSRADAETLCRYADDLDLTEPIHLIVHCHLGRSRSAAAAAIVLVRLGHDARTAFDIVRSSRDPVWPNRTLLEHGDAVLGCEGRLLEVAEDVYADVQRLYPRWVSDPRPENA